MTSGKFASFTGRALFFAGTCQYYTNLDICSCRCKFPDEILRVDVITLYNRGTNISCMSYAGHAKLKDLLH